jgi:Outer membrane receptor for ferrienterochelin and colicins
MRKLESWLFAGVSVLAFVSAHGAAVAAETADLSGAETVIITGTRFTGTTALDSAAPVSVVSGAELANVGQPDLINALNRTVPSFNAEAQGYDLSALTLTARLRGLSPNDTLVLVNGKRRHITSNIHADGAEFGAFQGADPADLNFIPVSAIDRVEVLQDGAAAQYGSDAIAGVINIILKNSDNGGTASVTAGQYYKGDGDTLAGAGNIGFKLLDKGFVNLTVESRYHGFSQRGGVDVRFFNRDGTAKTGLGWNPAAIPGSPYLNQWSGDAEYNLTTVSANAGYDFGSVELYSFGTFGAKVGQSKENYRAPNKVVYGTTELYPQGFTPREYIGERDYEFTVGARGKLADWGWDLSSTYGKDAITIRTLDSANAAIYAATGHTTLDFYDGAFATSLFTINADINRSFNVGLAGPLGIAFGGEFREDTYQIKAGEPDSYYAGGAQSFPGFLPTDAGIHSRKNYATYVDVSLIPLENLKIDLAGRYEHFSDFGDATIGKITARYDFSPSFALRGTISTGFRAPTLAEEYFSATNVGPSWATVVLPPDSAAAALIGIAPLKPEKSTQFSVGAVARVFDGLTATLDAYSIVLGDRIVSTGNLYGKGGAVNSPAVNAAITAHGNDVSSPDFSSVQINIFTNGINTRTRGIDLALNYATDLGASGTIDWSLDGNFNETVVTRVAATPAQLAGQVLYDLTAKSNLTSSSPKEKVSLGAIWTWGDFSLSLRETIYGPSYEWNSPDGGTYYKNEVKTAAVTDIEASYAFTDYLKVTFGANNLFDKNPETIGLTPSGSLTTGNTALYDNPNPYSPYGTNGGYYYVKLSTKF